jgi:hypothetical protein
MSGARTRQLATMVRVCSALASRPRLWPAALGAARSHAPARWWARPPFLPLPDREWLTYRTVTAYGGDGTTPISVDDLITWLEWRHRFPR